MSVEPHYLDGPSDAARTTRVVPMFTCAICLEHIEVGSRCDLLTGACHGRPIPDDIEVGAFKFDQYRGRSSFTITDSEGS